MPFHPFGPTMSVPPGGLGDRVGDGVTLQVGSSRYRMLWSKMTAAKLLGLPWFLLSSFPSPSHCLLFSSQGPLP